MAFSPRDGRADLCHPGGNRARNQRWRGRTRMGLARPGRHREVDLGHRGRCAGRPPDDIAAGMALSRRAAACALPPQPLPDAAPARLAGLFGRAVCADGSRAAISNGVRTPMRLRQIFLAGLLAAAGTAQAGADIRMTSELEELVGLYRRGDYQAAFKGLSKHARQGEAYAQGLLGKMYADGQGTPQNHALAVEWLSRAAARGDDLAQNRLGDMYAEGRGLPQDLEKAVAYYRDAAEQYNAAACYSLGLAYEEGRGVAVDHAAALRYYRLAAKLGNAGAQFELDNPSTEQTESPKQ